MLVQSTAALTTEWRERLEVLDELSEPALGARVVLQTLCERVVLELIGQTGLEGFFGARVIAQTQVASHDMLEETRRRLLGQIEHHEAEDLGDVREALVGLADVGEARVVGEYLLQDECGHRFGQLAAVLHDFQAQRNDFGAEQERNHVLLVGLNPTNSKMLHFLTCTENNE